MWKLLLLEPSVQRSIPHEFFSVLILLDWLKAINRVFNNAQKSETQGKTQCSVAIWCMGWWWQGCVVVSSRSGAGAVGMASGLGWCAGYGKRDFASLRDWLCFK
jgi:hypothetical protein